MQFLQKWAGAYKAKLVYLGILSVLTGGSIVLQGYSIVQIVNAVFIEKAQFDVTYNYLILLIIAIFIRLYTQYWISKIGGNLAKNVKNTIRGKLLHHWSQNALEQQISSQTGEKVTLYVDTVDQLESYYREYIPQVIKTLIIPIIVLIAVFYVHPNSGWIMLVTAPFIPITYIIIGMQTKAKTEKQLDAMNKFSGKFLDLLQGLQTIRLFGQSKRQEEVLEASNKSFMDRTLSVLKIAFASTLFIELITTLGIGLVALEIGFQMIVFKTLSFAPAFFVLTLAPEYYNSLKELGAAFHTGRGSLGAAAIIEEQLKQQVKPVQWGDNALGKKPSITLNEAVYRYQNGPTIGPVSMHISPGDTVALIGKTGHGKTTILNMLSSLLELSEGELLLNGMSRQQIRDQEWYAQMSYISQNPYIFAGTLRENICMGRKASDEEIYKALEQAQLTSWLQTIPGGLELLLGEGGHGLSGGEKQRVAIARAFLKKPSTVFFDEPTAGLDVLTEKLLSASIQSLNKFATVIVAAHQFESIQFAKTIFIIEDGQILAAGSHEQLANHPYYVQMMKGGVLNEAARINDMA